MAPGRIATVALSAAALVACGNRPERPAVSRDGGPAGPRAAVRAGPLGQPGEGPMEPEEQPPAVCPMADADPDAVLDETGRLLYDAGDLHTALACAELSVDLVPQAVEAHHYRAAALAALGRYSEAQVAFAMALARDPDDPETLAAAADFYVNITLPKHRSGVQLGLEYARRGSGRAASRRRLDRRLRARLFLLEAEALNDLGQSDLALARVDAALKLSSQLSAALHERGVSLFSLCRFRDAEDAFVSVLREYPDDPYAHYHLGLIYERDGRQADAEAHFARARVLAPEDFPAPVLIGAEEFAREVSEALAELDEDMRRDVTAVSIELVDLPAMDDLVAVEPPFAPTIMGLYRGLPLGVTEPASSSDGEAEPRAADVSPGDLASGVPARAIVLYRKNLARAVRTRDELDRQIRRTLVHEIGHLQGLDEDELRRRGLE